MAWVQRNLLLLGNTDSLTTTASSLGVLTTNLDTPVVAETTVSADLLQTLKILTELVIESVGQNLRVLTVTVVLLSVQEPVGDLVLARVLDNSNDLVDLLLGELTSALGQINVSLLAGQSGEAAAETLDGAEGNDNLLATINVGVKHTENVCEVLLVLDNKSHFVFLCDLGR